MFLAAWALVPVDFWLTYAGLTRLCGYLAAAALAVPYLHILRRGFRHRYWGGQTAWLWWRSRHIRRTAGEPEVATLPGAAVTTALHSGALD